MSDVYGADLVDAITEWVDRADEDLDEHDIEAILRIQLAIDASHWSGVDIAELTQGDIASLKHSLIDVDAPEFSAWVIDETLRGADIVAPRGPARKAPSSRRSSQPKKNKKKKSTAQPPADEPPADEPPADAVVDDTTDERVEHEVDTADDRDDPVVADSPSGDAERDADGADPDLNEELDQEDPDPSTEDPSTEDPSTEDADDFFGAAGDAEELDAPRAEQAEDAERAEEPEEAVTLGGAFAAAVAAPTGGAFAAAAASADDLLVDRTTADVSDPDRSAGFFAELERNTTASVTGPAPLELIDGPDSLGPAFLPASTTSEGRGRRIGLFVVAAVAIVAFVLAGVQLANSVNDPNDDEVAVDADADVSADPETAADDAELSDSTDPDGSGPDGNGPDGNGPDGNDPDGNDPDENDPTDDTERPDDDASSTADDGSDDELTPEEAAARLLATPEPTPEPDLPPAEKTAIVLTEDGDIWSIDLFADSFGQPSLVHDSDEHGDATDVSLVSAGLGIVDEDGNAFIASRTEVDERVRVWRSDRLGEARTIVEGSGQYAVLDTAGSVSLFDDNRAATRLSIDTVWDTQVGGTPPARDIDNYVDLVAFAVGDGDVQLIQTSDDTNPVFQVWDGETQPRAFNVDINDNGLFMGVGAGAIARYQWFEDGPLLSAVWDPLAGSRLPAIGYASLGDRTAVVLENGSVAAIDTSGSGPILWDAEVSDLRAVSITTLDDEVLLVLQGGTVLRVAGDGETQNRGSIWDVTDESTSPAVKVLITSP